MLKVCPIDDAILRDVVLPDSLLSSHRSVRLPVVLIEWDEAPNCIWAIRLPEYFGTASFGQGAYQHDYMWKNLNQGHLLYESTPISDKRFTGDCSAEVIVEDANHIGFSLSVTNKSERCWDDFYGWVCLLHRWAEGFAGNHYVYKASKQIHVATIDAPKSLWGKWCSIEGEKDFSTEIQKIVREKIRPFTADKRQLDTERIWDSKLQRITIYSENAALLGWSHWPCTDMALKFGKVCPRENKKVSGQLTFRSEELKGA